MRSALVLQTLPGVCALDDEDDLAEPTVIRCGFRENANRPAPLLGVVGIHVVEVAGEEIGLFTALCAADLDDDVTSIVRIFRDEEAAQLRFETKNLFLRDGELVTE